MEYHRLFYKWAVHEKSPSITIKKIIYMEKIA